MPQFIWISGPGCLLPFLIIFNLLFGRLIFNSVLLWLGIEVGLILLLIISINLMARKISRGFTAGSQSHKAPKGVVDIQGHVVEEEKRLK